MSSKIFNLQPYLITSRKFPTEKPTQLETELSKSYVDTANAVNAREIALYALQPTITGQQWYTSAPSQKQQTLRQIYNFKDGNLTISHGITNFQGITRIFGTFYDGTTWYPLPYVSPTAANQVSVVVNATDIVITKGGSAPVISSGTVVIEWLAAA